MTDTLRIKRRHTGAIGAPTVLTASELAFNEVDSTLYYGSGDSGGNATNIIPIAGRGAFLPLTGGQLSGGLSFGSRIPFPSDPTNTTGHISLYDGWGGFSITGGSLNVVAGGALQMNYDGAHGFMHVPLYLSRDPPIDAAEAATKNYVDNNTITPAAGDARWVNVSGDTMTGPLTINNSLQVSNGVFSCYANNQTVPASGAGLSVVWNFSGGNGEVNYFATYSPSADPIHSWHQVTGTGTQRTLAQLGAGIYRLNGQPTAQIVLNKAAGAGNVAMIQGATAGSTRWIIQLGDGTGESTGNVGSNFSIFRYDNSGNSLGASLQINRASGDASFGNGLSVAGALTASGGATTFSGDASFLSGIDFGSATAPLNAASDLSRHIALYAASYGFSITGSRLNLVCGTGAAHYFVAGSSDIGYINSTGLNMPVGAAAASTGAFTTLSANSTVNFNAAGLVTLGTNTTLTMTNAAIGYDGDGVSTSANDLSLQSRWGVGFQNLNVAAQQVPGGLYGAFIDARTGNVNANRIFVTDTAGSSQIQNLRFASTTADQVIEAFPTYGYATGPVVVVSGGTGWAVNDRAYDANKNFYTVTAVSGGAATSVAINTRASTTAIPTNPITLTAGPLPVSTGAGLTVNINYTSSTRLVLQHTTGAILLNSANGTQVTGPLTLDRDPTAALGAATKQYVDSTIVVSDIAPTGVRDNTFWFDSSGTGLYLRFNDGNSTQWVLVAGGNRGT